MLQHNAKYESWLFQNSQELVDFYLLNDNFATGVSLIIAILLCHEELI